MKEKFGEQFGSDASTLPPLKMRFPGTSCVFPRRNTEHGGARKSKATYRCKLCKKLGHTSPRCPLNKNKK